MRPQLGWISTLGLCAAAAAVIALSAPGARGANPEPPGNAEAGKAVFAASCAVCHGPTGSGDGPAAAGLNPKPANFSDPVRMAKSSEARRLQVVRQGGAAAGLSPLMPAFQAVLNEQQLRDVLAFVETTLIQKGGVTPK